MTQIRKVPLSAGAEWVLGGFALLRKAPVALSILGLIWGGLSALASFTGQVWMSLVLAVLGPILFGGVIYAAREVDQGRSPAPGHLLQGLREGRGGRLLAMLLPQLIALAVLVVLLVVMIGPAQLEHIAQVMEQMKTNPDPELAQKLPAGRMMGWLLVALVVGLVAGLFTFLAIPDVMFTERGAFAAMAVSFRACMRNLGALLMMTLLLFIAVFAMSLACNLLMYVLALAIGQMPAMFVAQLLLMSVMLPLMGGVVYYAWRGLLGEAPLPAASAGTGSDGHIEA